MKAGAQRNQDIVAQGQTRRWRTELRADAGSEAVVLLREVPFTFAILLTIAIAVLKVRNID